MSCGRGYSRKKAGWLGLEACRTGHVMVVVVVVVRRHCIECPRFIGVGFWGGGKIKVSVERV